MEKRFTNENVKVLRSGLNDAMEQFGKKYGLMIHFGDAKYDPLNCTFQVKVSFAPGEDFDPVQALWEVHCGRIGFAPGDMGKEFSFYGNPERYKLVGYNPNAKSNCLVILRLRDNKKFSATPENVYNAIYGPQNPTPLQEEGALWAKKIGDRKIWDSFCWRSGLKPEDFGKTIQLWGGVPCVIVGYDDTARSNTILIEPVGKDVVYAVSSRIVKKALKIAIL